MFSCDNCHETLYSQPWPYGPSGLLLCGSCFDIATEGARFPDNVSWDESNPSELPGTLAVREQTGIHVAVRHLAAHDAVLLDVEVGDRRGTTIVPSDCTLDAFEHPFTYLSTALTRELVQR